MSSPESLAHDTPYPAPAVAWYATGILAFLYWLSVLDRYIISLLVDPIKIVTIVSDAGRVGEARLAAYGAAKAGAAGFVRSIAKEAGRFGITSNAISLSSLEPPMNPDQLKQFLTSDQVKAQLSLYTIRRYGKPDDVAAMTLFLCSDTAGWITGQTYPVNGGYSFAI